MKTPILTLSLALAAGVTLALLTRAESRPGDPQAPPSCADCIEAARTVGLGKVAPDESVVSFNACLSQAGQPLFFSSATASLNHIGRVELATTFLPASVLAEQQDATLRFPGAAYTFLVRPLGGDWSQVDSRDDLHWEFVAND